MGPVIGSPQLGCNYREDEGMQCDVGGKRKVPAVRRSGFILPSRISQKVTCVSVCSHEK